MDDEEDNSWEAFLSETPLAKHIMELGKKRSEELGRVEGFKEALCSIVSARFPVLLTLAQKQTEHIIDTIALNALIAQVVTAQTEDDARQYLLSIE